MYTENSRLELELYLNSSVFLSLTLTLTLNLTLSLSLCNVIIRKFILFSVSLLEEVKTKDLLKKWVARAGWGAGWSLIRILNQNKETNIYTLFCFHWIKSNKFTFHIICFLQM